MRVRLLAALVLASAIGATPMSAQPPGSPHETVSAVVDGAKVSIAYGRPYMRGRKIVGGLVPYGRVWRTGADQATTLTTDAPLVIGGAAVPAGKVTLYTLPTAAGWKLVINKQTGQWGTQYGSIDDLASVPMSFSEGSEAVEMFTLSLARGAKANAGELTLQWGKAVLKAPFTVK